MSWPAARRPPISEYLLALAQPAMRMPSTDTDETARAKKMPAGKSAKQASGPNGTTSDEQERAISTTIGAILKMRRSAGRGTMSSFCSHLPTSANSCSEPYGPASIGPSRLCMKLIILNRKR